MSDVVITPNRGVATEGKIEFFSGVTPVLSGTLSISSGNITIVPEGAGTVQVGKAGNTTTIPGDLTVTGNLTINGTTTTVNSTTVTVDDPIFTIGGDAAPSSDDNKDRGIAFRWHNGTAAKLGFFGYDDSTGKFTFIADATDTSDVFSGTTGEIDAKLDWSNVLNKPTIGSGTVTSVSFTGGIVSVATATTTPALTVAGTSGGIPYFSSGTTWASSAALAANALVIGGGAGVAPSTTTTAAGILTFLGTPSSANLSSALTDKTGTGVNVFGTSPAITTSLTTPSTSFDLLDTTATTINFGRAANSIVMGSTSATITLRGGTVVGSETTQNVFNSAATTINAFGGATVACNVGPTTGSMTLRPPTINVGSGNATIKSTTGGGLTVTAGGGTLNLTAESSVGATGDRAYIQIPNTDAAAGEVRILGGNLYLGRKSADGVSYTGVDIVFEGSADDTSETTLTVTNPTADRTITLPDATGTVALTANNLSAFAATTSAQLAGVISDETGSGALVFATSPSLTTPTLGVASATSINKVAITAPATSATLTIADGKTLTASNTLTFTGTDASSVAFGTGGTVVYTSNKLSVHAATTSSELAGVISDETGSGALVFGTSPSLTTPALSGETFSTSAAVTAGTNAQGQGALTSDYNVITTAAANPSGVTLPTATTGRRIVIVNKGANPINVYPATGGYIDGLAINAAIAIPVNGVMYFNASSTTQWYSSANSSFSAPSLGAATATSINGLTITSSTGTLTVTNAKTLSVSNTLTFTGTDSSSVAFGTGGTVAYTSNNLGAFAATTSAQLAGVISDETGSGALVFATSPSLTTPTLGVASATSINKVAITAPATSATLTIADGKTLTASNTLTFTGTDASSVAFGTGGTVVYTSNKLSVHAATTSSELAGVISDETGSGALVFGTSPSFTTSLVAASATMALLDTTATTINFGRAATNITMGATNGTVTCQYNLVVSNKLEATTKSFVIDHPTKWKEGMKLRYACLEGPENGVYVRGALEDNDTIELPEYWVNLVDVNSITVNLTPIGSSNGHYVKSIKNNVITVGSRSGNINCHYIVYGERKDVSKLVVEYHAA